MGEIEKWDREFMQIPAVERARMLTEQMKEIRELTDNQDYLDSIDMCAKDLECPRVHQTIRQILDTIRILVRKQVK
jgi:phage terminase Nu1 subunit (DNA packaging protein)